jgi:Spy/CpxP family protein refolding chaperone
MKQKAVLVLVLLLSVTAIAQDRPPQPGPRPGDDPIAQNLFPPDLVMRHRQAIGLSAEQSEFIRTEVQKSQARFTDLQWQMMGEQETMANLLKQGHADEAQVLAELDKVLNLEREIKRAQLSLVIRIKNQLTPEQQAKLRELKQQEPQPQPMPR